MPPEWGVGMGIAEWEVDMGIASLARTLNDHLDHLDHLAPAYGPVNQDDQGDQGDQGDHGYCNALAYGKVQSLCTGDE